ncbi:hypothetical protein JRI60_07280 [Archangium violaceum]|uniref:hypothetical protein n=1 Tax=Archangium violaceum TaxID=83451 RepID=UPI001951B8F0|nr:hypothetical protein [Archangium violaceum]QRN98824.1 hypothetical protein JRI60_07280 [Archangium violaceum]
MRSPHRLLLTLGLLLTATNATAQERPACAANPLVGFLSDGTHDVLGTALMAGQQWDTPPEGVALENWPALRAEALTRLQQVLATCNADKPLTPPTGTAFHGIYERYRPTLTETLERYVASNQLSSPVFSQVLGAVGGIPAPQRLQVGLSQIVSAGQPGLAGNIAGALSPHSEHFIPRHTSLTGSLLVIQPVRAADSTEPTELGQPQFASAETMLAFSSRRTAYDWSIEVSNRMQEIIKKSEQQGLFATQQFLRRIQASLELRQPAERLNQQEEKARLDAAPSEAREQLRTEIDQARKLREQENLRAALEEASEAARRFYLETMETYFTRTFIQPELDREKYPFHLDVALRVRVTPRPDFVPELPDLFSTGLEVAGDGALLGGRDSSQLLYNFRVLTSGSAYPTRVCSRFSGCDAQASLLLDAAAGLGVTLPSRDMPSDTVFRVAGLLRWAPFRDISINGQMVDELSGGFSASLEVPVAPTLSLLGSYTMRWVKGGSAVATSGITIAKTLPK